MRRCVQKKLSPEQEIRYNARMKSLLSYFRPAHRPTLEEAEEARERRAAGIRSVIGVSTLILLVLVSILMGTLVLSPLLELRTLERRLATVKAQLEQVRKEEAREHDFNRWMDDPEFFEQIARERANQAKPGETVIRFAEPEKGQK